MENIVLVFGVVSVGAIFISAYAMHLAVSSAIEVQAIKKSTHSVQLVPADSMAWDKEERAMNSEWNKGHGLPKDELDEVMGDDDEQKS